MVFKKQTSFNFIFWGLIVAYILYHLLTLAISPLPWFDEVIFANITNNYYNSGKLLCDIYPWRFPEGQEILYYGPVYFIFTKLSWAIGGIGIWQFRIVNFTFGVMSVVLLYQIAKLYISDKRVRFLTLSLIATDPVFIQNAHCGRMDLVALFFVVASLFLLLRNKENNLWLLGVSGIMSALALLTTPRVFFLEIGLGIVLLYKIISLRSNLLKSVLSFILPIVVLYSLWIMLTFDNFDHFINYYSQNKTITGHFGGNWNVSSFQYPLLLAILISYVFTLKMKLFKQHFIAFYLWFTLASLILFYLLIYDYGHYNAMVLPFGMLAIFIVFESLRNELSRKTLIVAVSILLTINIGIFTAKSIVILSTINQRSTNQVSEIIEKVIAQNSKVIGDDRYFYACIEKGITYQSIEEGNIHRSDIDRLIKYQSKHFDFDFLILSNEAQVANPKILEIYSSEYEIVKITDIILAHRNNKGSFIGTISQKLLGHKVQGSLDGVIYKRIKK